MTNPLRAALPRCLIVPELDFGAFRSLSATLAMALSLAVAWGHGRSG